MGYQSQEDEIEEKIKYYLFWAVVITGGLLWATTIMALVILKWTFKLIWFIFSFGAKLLGHNIEAATAKAVELQPSLKRTLLVALQKTRAFVAMASEKVAIVLDEGCVVLDKAQIAVTDKGLKFWTKLNKSPDESDEKSAEQDLQ